MYDMIPPTRFSFGLFDFGGGANEQFVIRGPKGKKGQLWDYGVYASTEVFAGSTSTPQMSVGTSSDADAYGEEFDFGALAVNKMMSVGTQYDRHRDSTSFDAVIVDPWLPADTDIYVTCIAAVGTPTGIAVPFIDVIWEL